jgi:hypothetical protein
VPEVSCSRLVIVSAIAFLVPLTLSLSWQSFGLGMAVSFAVGAAG